ncbi:UDP-N-acetylmuramoyl-L-alanine--D-glutamate ligase [Alphaproteobacteria bacterium]|nr:UDP-N-acetylmuramoyl-L-alanine--D-glutamate ligase [Alphaproteobacteria bacterium]
MKYIYGLKKSGLSLVTYFNSINEEYYCWDDDAKTREKLIQFNLKTKLINPNNLNVKLIDEAFITPGISLKDKKIDVLKKNNIKLFRDLELYSRLIFHKKIIAVTGTNGKSTTTKLIGDILELCKIKNFIGGNIGLPLIEFKNLKISEIYHVIELSSFQLESAPSFSPFISILLNLSPDHLDRYDSYEEYASQKEKIISSNQNSFNIISLDDEMCSKIFNKNKQSNMIPISLNPIKKGIFFKNGEIVDKFFCKNGILSIPKISPSISSSFNKQNILAAYAVVKILKLNLNKFVECISNFVGLPHRMEEIINNKAMCIINNSKATNVDAAVKSLQNYKNVTLILGGQAKEESFISFINQKDKINKIYLIGKSANMIFQQLESSIDCQIFDKLENALKKILIDNDRKKELLTILFSPACTSFDQYKNFEDRGNHFKNLVFSLVL